MQMSCGPVRFCAQARHAEQTQKQMRKGLACLRCVFGVAVGDQVKFYVVGETIVKQRRGHFGGELGAVGAEAFLIEANGYLVLRLEIDNMSVYVDLSCCGPCLLAGRSGHMGPCRPGWLSHTWETSRAVHPADPKAMYIIIIADRCLTSEPFDIITRSDRGDRHSLIGGTKRLIKTARWSLNF